MLAPTGSKTSETGDLTGWGQEGLRRGLWSSPRRGRRHRGEGWVTLGPDLGRNPISEVGKAEWAKE